VRFIRRNNGIVEGNLKVGVGLSLSKYILNAQTLLFSLEWNFVLIKPISSKRAVFSLQLKRKEFRLVLLKAKWLLV
jgi:predicted membrane-bound spermidine synthase